MSKNHFLTSLPKKAFALSNIDDKNGLVMLQNTKARKFTYALKSMRIIKRQILENQFKGLLLKINDNEVWTSLIGNFNAYNILAIYGAADLLGIEKVETLKHISELRKCQWTFSIYHF